MWAAVQSQLANNFLFKHMCREDQAGRYQGPSTISAYNNLYGLNGSVRHVLISFPHNFDNIALLGSSPFADIFIFTAQYVKYLKIHEFLTMQNFFSPKRSLNVLQEILCIFANLFVTCKLLEFLFSLYYIFATCK